MNERLITFFSFENEAFIFPTVHHGFKFALLVSGWNPNRDATDYCIFVRHIEQLADSRRHFRLDATQIATINPNTKTAPVFRTSGDATLTIRIYDHVPILLNDTIQEGNPWDMSFGRLFDMSADSGLFGDVERFSSAVNTERFGSSWQVYTSLVEGDESTGWHLPLYEAKLIHLFDHRWATYQGVETRDATDTEKSDPTFEVNPRYWVHERELTERLASKQWRHPWLMGWRDITNATNERTIISSAFPLCACGDTLLLMFPSAASAEACMGLIANLCSLVLDYSARQKIGGTHMKYNMFKQLPILPPTHYASRDLSFIVPRVLELTYTSYSMTPFARDLGYAGEPFPWNEDRRALLRAELDAWYARAYGLSRDDLRYILDPADLLGPDYPSETFRVLKKNEIAKFGEYRTQRLVLDAWDRQAAGLTPASEVPVEVPVVLPTEIDYAALPDGSWTIHRPEPFNPTVPAARLLAAILAEFSQPAPTDHIGLIYAFASRPEKLTPFLQSDDRANWLRLVGTDAQPPNAGILQMPVRTDLPFADALNWLRSKNALHEDLEKRTWQRGSRDSGLHLAGWPEGRARFVHKILKKLGFDNLRSKLVPEDIVWEEPKRA
jgi:hypothetical protein